MNAEPEQGKLRALAEDESEVNQVSEAVLHQSVSVGLLPVWWTRALSLRCVPLELHRAEVPDWRVASTRVVEPLDAIEHGVRQQRNRKYSSAEQGRSGHSRSVCELLADKPRVLSV